MVDIAREGEPRAPYRMANPEVVHVSEELASYEEGCLSLPEHYSEVTRPAEATIRYLDENDQRREIEVEGVSQPASSTRSTISTASSSSTASRSSSAT